MTAAYATGGAALPAAYRCTRCGEWASHHYGPPSGHADKGRLHACGDHAPAAESKWREIYGVTR